MPIIKHITPPRPAGRWIIDLSEEEMDLLEIVRLRIWGPQQEVGGVATLQIPFNSAFETEAVAVRDLLRELGSKRVTPDA